MREMSAHEFRSHLREAVEEVVADHIPLRVKRRGGQDFVCPGQGLPSAAACPPAETSRGPRGLPRVSFRTWERLYRLRRRAS